MPEAEGKRDKATAYLIIDEDRAIDGYIRFVGER